jgi:hypothetical protein
MAYSSCCAGLRNREAKKIACMTLHNFIRDSNLSDVNFDSLILDETYVFVLDETYVDGDMRPFTSDAVDEEDMRVVRDVIDQALMGGH